MTNKLKIITSLKELSPENIDAFISEYAAIIQALVKNNNGNEKQYRKVLLDVISELYFRVRNDISFDKYDPDVLVYTLAYLALKKSYSGNPKDRKPIILDKNYYEKGSLKFLSSSYTKDEEKCDSIIRSMGEPGRTILRLSFFENEEDEIIAKHVHFESCEQLKNRRVKLLERCIESS